MVKNLSECFIIQQIRTMPIYGQKVIAISRPYVTDILQYTYM